AVSSLWWLATAVVHASGLPGPFDLSRVVIVPAEMIGFDSSATPNYRRRTSESTSTDSWSTGPRRRFGPSLIAGFHGASTRFGAGTREYGPFLWNDGPCVDFRGLFSLR